MVEGIWIEECYEMGKKELLKADNFTNFIILFYPAAEVTHGHKQQTA